MSDERAELWRMAPTELAPGEDPQDRFLAEHAKVGGSVARATPATLAAEVIAALSERGASRVALTADLADARPVISAALAGARFAVSDYEEIADDRAEIRRLDATVTGCLAAVAATGSIATGGAAGRGGALVAPLHICIVETRRVVTGLTQLMRLSKRLGGGSILALQSGPSRTADIEKTLIIGVHGPKWVHVILLEGILNN
jgi:L-lactate utilization protein LutC